MANALYDKGREGYLNGNLNWLTDDIRVILIDTASYTVDLATHEFLTSVPAPARIAVSGSLTTKTATNGVADADDATFSLVSGASVEAVIIYKHTGADATARLIAYLDTLTGVPFTPSGGNVAIQWDNGANKIFKLLHSLIPPMLPWPDGGREVRARADGPVPGVQRPRCARRTTLLGMPLFRP